MENLPAQRAVTPYRQLVRLPASRTVTGDGFSRLPARKTAADDGVPAPRAARAISAAHHTPAGVLVNDGGDILFVHGSTGRYLEPAPGAANVNITRMAREGLRLELITALHKAVARKEGVRQTGVRITRR